MTDRKLIWLKSLLDSGTLRSRCKQFAPGLLYDTVSHPPDTNCILVIDSSTLLGGDEFNLRIVSHLKSMGDIQDQSTIRIRRMQVDDHSGFFTEQLNYKLSCPAALLVAMPGTRNLHMDDSSHLVIIYIWVFSKNLPLPQKFQTIELLSLSCIQPEH